MFGAYSQTQVADRWHLIENASAAFLDVVRQHMRTIREVLASNALDPSVLTSAERRQWDGFQRRKETTDAVLALTRAGTPIKAVVRQLGLARMTVRRIVRGGGIDMFRTRFSSARSPSRDTRCRLARRLPQWCRTLAALARSGLHRARAASWRSGRPGAVLRRRRVREATTEALVGPPDRPVSDNQSRSDPERTSLQHG